VQFEVFLYDYGVLSSKLQANEELGLSQSSIVTFIVSSPYLLLGNLNVQFVQVLEKLKSFGMEISWIEEHLFDFVFCKGVRDLKF
jgi:hypothetical protein